LGRKASVLLLAALAASLLAPKPAPAVGSGSFSQTGSLETARGGAGAALLADGRVLVVAGTNGTDVLASEAFDSQSGTFSSAGLPALSTGRYNVAAARLADGRVLIAGGNQGSATLQTTLIYDPQTNNISDGPMLTVPRANAAATLLADGRVLLAGGNNATGFLDSAEVYGPTTNVFSPVGSMTSVRTNAVAAALPGGRALVAGGRDDDPILASAEVFNPGANSFSAAGIGSMSVPRVAAVAAPLPDGRVLVAGGTNDSSPALATAEVFDPQTNGFSSAGIGAMGTGRTSAFAAPLADGRVLVAGGQNETSYLSRAEIFALDATPPENRGGVSNAFSFFVRGRKLIVKVQASGKVSVRRVRSRASTKRPRQLLNPSSASGGAPAIVVKLHLSKAAKQQLRRRGKLKIRARITFTPDGGLPNAKTAKLKIKGRKHRRHPHRHV
jgi:Galactose oxidase, central domain/Kelch motif